MSSRVDAVRGGCVRTVTDQYTVPDRDDVRVQVMVDKSHMLVRRQWSARTIHAAWEVRVSRAEGVFPDLQCFRSSMSNEHRHGTGGAYHLELRENEVDDSASGSVRARVEKDDDTLALINELPKGRPVGTANGSRRGHVCKGGYPCARSVSMRI